MGITSLSFKSFLILGMAVGLRRIMGINVMFIIK